MKLALELSSISVPLDSGIGIDFVEPEIIEGWADDSGDVWADDSGDVWAE